MEMVKKGRNQGDHSERVTEAGRTRGIPLKLQLEIGKQLLEKEQTGGKERMGSEGGGEDTGRWGLLIGSGHEITYPKKILEKEAHLGTGKARSVEARGHGHARKREQETESRETGVQVRGRGERSERPTAASHGIKDGALNESRVDIWAERDVAGGAIETLLLHEPSAGFGLGTTMHIGAPGRVKSRGEEAGFRLKPDVLSSTALERGIRGRQKGGPVRETGQPRGGVFDWRKRPTVILPRLRRRRA
jgi:hypothetical protein